MKRCATYIVRPHSPLPSLSQCGPGSRTFGDTGRMSRIRSIIGVCRMVAVLTFGMVGAVASAQQVLEIDFANGRDVINDDMRAVIPWQVAIDHLWGALYVRDLEEPDGVMVFSLASGERLRTYRIPKGDGPAELRQLNGFAPASDRGLYVLGDRKVLRLDSLGAVAGYWQVTGPRARSICEFGGQPTLGIQGGLKRRGPDGVDESIGSRVVEVEGESWVRVVGEDWSDVLKWRGAKLACTPDVAYLVFPNEEVVESPGSGIRRYSNTGPDSVLVFFGNGREGRLEVPAEFADERAWNRDLKPSIDTNGDLVLASSNGGVPGAIVDLSTGCYGVLRNREYQLHREFAGIYRDSALVFHRDREEVTVEGQRVVTLYTEARQISLNPLRRVSGQPCPGMLPSVEDARLPGLGGVQS